MPTPPIPYALTSPPPTPSSRCAVAAMMPSTFQRLCVSAAQSHCKYMYIIFLSLVRQPIVYFSSFYSFFEFQITPLSLFFAALFT